MQKTNVPNIRVAFRHETLKEELDALRRYAPKKGNSDLNEEAMTKHDFVGVAGLAESSAIQQHLMSRDLKESEKEDQEEEDDENWIGSEMSTFPGASMVAERAKLRSSNH